MERFVISLLMLLACLLASSVSAQSAENVKATGLYFYAKEYDYDMDAAKVYCAPWIADKPYEWRSQYNWAAIPYGFGQLESGTCGKCIHVTNIATGDEAIVRIVSGSHLKLRLDVPVFDQLDSDGQGKANNQIFVNYRFVDCDPKPAPPGESNASAPFTYYNVKENKWNYTTANVACATKDGNKSLEWRKRYGWTGFCGNVGPQGLDACGKCLKVINTDTKEKKIVRIVDTCGEGPLVLDYETAFKPIDSNGKGEAIGHLVVDYEFVDCGDPKDSLLVYSQ